MVKCVHIQFKICQWQSRWHSQDLALPATRMEKHRFGHGCKAARVRELLALYYYISVTLNCASVSCLV